MTWSTIGGSSCHAYGCENAWADGDSATAKFNRPSGVAVDSNGNNIYVADTENYAIRHGYTATAGGLPMWRTIGGACKANQVYCGAGYANGRGTVALFLSPVSIAVNEGSSIYVVERVK